jgi:hypothetical protein
MKNKIPASWAECSPRQLKKALPLVLAIRTTDDQDLTLPLYNQLVQVLTGLQDVAELPLVARNDLYDAVRWAINTPITEPPFPYVRVGLTRYYLPQPAYADSSTIEVAMANIYYLAYSNPKAPNPDALYEFLAIILRPRRFGWQLRKHFTSYDGDDRQPYNSLRASQRAKKLRRLSLETILPIILYWEHHNNAFVQRYANLYDAAPDARTLFHNGEGWLSTIEDVAENRVHGNFDRVCATNVHTIWLYLKHKKIKNDEQLRQMEAQSQA